MDLALFVGANKKRSAYIFPLGHDRRGSRRAVALLRLAIIIPIKNTRLRLESVIDVSVRHLHGFLAALLELFHPKLHERVPLLAKARRVGTRVVLLDIGKKYRVVPGALGAS